MARSTWKGVFFSKTVYYSILRSFFFKQTRTTVFTRSSSIPQAFLSTICSVHKGMDFKHIIVRRLSIGHKFGIFGFTRKNYHFTPKEKKIKLRR